MSLEVLLFGSLSIQVGGDAAPRLRTRKEQWLLTLLLLHHDRALDRTWLANLLWPESTEPAALHNLRRSLMNLRDVLGTEAGRLLTPGPGLLRLDVTAAQVDVLTFDRAIVRGGIASLEQAISLYRGSLLEGCQEDWILPEREARRQAYLHALEASASYCAAAGRYGEAARLLHRLLVADVTRESAVCGLMQALAAQGDHAAVTQVYRDFRIALHRELHAEPSEETTALYHSLRKPASSPPPNPASPPPADDAPLRRLPVPLTPLIGRKEDIAMGLFHLRSTRLLTLTGMGGVGKTRLAIAIAEESASRYRDGVWFVELASLTEASLIPQAVLSVLGVREEAGRAPTETLGDFLASKSALLLLDNCEHLLEACASLVEKLLSSSGLLSVLTTSRQSLGIAGERVFRVPSLSVLGEDDPAYKEKDLASLALEFSAIRLFVTAASAVRPGFSLTPRNAREVTEICAKLDGIPLAIELAAAQIKGLTVSEINHRLRDGFDLLARTRRSGLSRQETLRATLDWSYSLLSDAERETLQRLSVFIGGATLQAAEMVCAGEGLASSEVMPALTNLVDASLVAFEEEEESARYRLLETVRHYASEKLGESGQSADTRERFVAYFLSLAETRRDGSEQQRQLALLSAERANLRAAMEWSTGEMALRLGWALWTFWAIEGHFQEGRALLQSALSNPGPPAARSKVLYAASVLYSLPGDYAAARPLLEESLALCTALEDKYGSAAALNGLGNLSRALNDYVAARHYLERGLAIRRALGVPDAIATSLSCMALVATDQGDFAVARQFYEECLTIWRQIGESQKVASTLAALAGDIIYEMGDSATAFQMMEEGLSLLRAIGDRHGTANTLGRLGVMHRDRGDLITARQVLEESLELRQELNDRWGISGCYYSLGVVAQDNGDYLEAQRLHQQSLSIKRSIGHKHGIIEALEGLAASLLEQDQASRAIRLWGAAESARNSLGIPLQPSQRPRYEHQIATARASIGSELFHILWTEGSALSLDEAADFAT